MAVMTALTVTKTETTGVFPDVVNDHNHEVELLDQDPEQDRLAVPDERASNSTITQHVTRISAALTPISLNHAYPDDTKVDHEGPESQALQSRGMQMDP